MALPLSEDLHVTFSPEDAVAKVLSGSPPSTTTTTTTPAVSTWAQYPFSEQSSAQAVTLSGQTPAAKEPRGAEPVGASEEAKEVVEGQGKSVVLTGHHGEAEGAEGRAGDARLGNAASCVGVEVKNQGNEGCRGGRTHSVAVDPASQLRNSLMRLSLTATRGVPEEEEALGRVANSSIADGEVTHIHAHTHTLTHTRVLAGCIRMCPHTQYTYTHTHLHARTYSLAGEERRGGVVHMSTCRGVYIGGS